jgi:hypothetical protein
MTRWMHVWAWAEEEERQRRLQEALAYFKIDPSEVLGLPDVEDELLRRYDEATERPGG